MFSKATWSREDQNYWSASMDDGSSAKKSKKSGGIVNLFRDRIDQIKRPKSDNASSGQLNSTRVSGAHDIVPGKDAGSPEPTASRLLNLPPGSNATSHQGMWAVLLPLRSNRLPAIQTLPPPSSPHQVFQICGIPPLVKVRDYNTLNLYT